MERSKGPSFQVLAHPVPSLIRKRDDSIGTTHDDPLNCIVLYPCPIQMADKEYLGYFFGACESWENGWGDSRRMVGGKWGGHPSTISAGTTLYARPFYIAGPERVQCYDYWCYRSLPALPLGAPSCLPPPPKWTVPDSLSIFYTCLLLLPRVPLPIVLFYTQSVLIFPLIVTSGPCELAANATRCVHLINFIRPLPPDWVVLMLFGYSGWAGGVPQH